MAIALNPPSQSVLPAVLLMAGLEIAVTQADGNQVASTATLARATALDAKPIFIFHWAAAVRVPRVNIVCRAATRRMIVLTTKRLRDIVTKIVIAFLEIARKTRAVFSIRTQTLGVTSVAKLVAWPST